MSARQVHHPMMRHRPPNPQALRGTAGASCRRTSGFSTCARLPPGALAALSPTSPARPTCKFDALRPSNAWRARRTCWACSSGTTTHRHSDPRGGITRGSACRPPPHRPTRRSPTSSVPGPSHSSTSSATPTYLRRSSSPTPHMRTWATASAGASCASRSRPARQQLPVQPRAHDVAAAPHLTPDNGDRRRTAKEALMAKWAHDYPELSESERRAGEQGRGAPAHTRPTRMPACVSSWCRRAGRLGRPARHCRATQPTGAACATTPRGAPRPRGR